MRIDIDSTHSPDAVRQIRRRGFGLRTPEYSVHDGNVLRDYGVLKEPRENTKYAIIPD